MTTTTAVAPAEATSPRVALDPNAIQARARASDLTAVADAWVIESAADAEGAATDLKQIVLARKTLEDLKKQHLAPFEDGVKQLKALFDSPIQATKQAETILRKKMSLFLEKQEAARCAAEEAQRKADEERNAALQAAEQQANAHIESGNLEEAMAVMETVDLVAPAPVAAPTANLGGISGTRRWSAEVVDLEALIIACADKLKAGDKSLLPYLAAEQTVLNKLAVALKDAMSVPGVKAVSKLSTTVR